MRRLVAIAGLSVAGALFSFTTPASACDPYKPPLGCENACTISQDVYYFAYSTSGGYRGPLPYWYDLNLGVCGT